MSSVRSRVTVTRAYSVVLTVDGPDAQAVWACSNRCATRDCAASCPTAVTEPGECTGPNTAHAICRTFFDENTYERAGDCAVPENDPDTRRVACVDNSEERQARKNAAHDVKLLEALIVIPLTIVVALGAAGQRT